MALTPGQGVELITSGEKAGSWGTVTNNNLQALEEGISRYDEVTLPIEGFVGATSTLDVVAGSLAGTAASVGRSAVIKFTGTIGATHTVVLNMSGSTSVEKHAVFINDTTGGYDVIIKSSTATTVAIPHGYSALIHLDNSFNVVNSLASLSVDEIILENGETIVNDVNGEIGLEAAIVNVGLPNATGTLESNGAGSLVLQTGGTTGSITLADGINGNISITPHGTGSVVAGGRITSGGGLNAGGSITGATTIEASGNITGTWNGDIIPEAKLQNQSGTNTGDNPGVTSITRGAGLGSGSITTTGTIAVDGNLEDLDALGAVPSNGNMIVGTGAGAYAYESGATLRTSIGVGTGDSPQLAGIELGHATANTLTASGGVLSIEGSVIYNQGGALGTPGSGTMTNVSGTAAGLTAGAATLAVSTSSLKTSTGSTTVNVASASAPAVGEVLTATADDTATWQAPVVGDITDVLGGTNITVSSSGGPQPTVNLDNAISLGTVAATSMTASSHVQTPSITSLAGVSIYTSSNNNVLIAPNGTGTVQITGGQYLNLSSTAGSGGYGLRGTSSTLNASNTASDGWGQVYHSGMTDGEGAYYENLAVATITSSGAQVSTAGHGLSAIPRIVKASMRYVGSGEHGYSANDEIPLATSGSNYDGTDGITVVVDATNITFCFPSTYDRYVINKSTGTAQQTMTASDWRLAVRAWK